MNLNSRSVVLMIAALVIAGVTALLARSWLGGERPVQAVAAPAEVAETLILTAAMDLPTGRILQKGDLAWQPWPAKRLPDAYVQRASGGEMDELYGSVVRAGVRNAEPVVRTNMVKQGEQGFLAAVLTPGMRAVSISVGSTSGISGFIFPGDRVDLILTQEIETKSADGESHITKRASETVLTNVRIIGVDQRTDDQLNVPTVAKTVTIEVTPAQAERVALAAQMGGLSLSLHSLGDPAVEAMDGAALDKGIPVEGRTHTWDSQVSKIISGGGKGQEMRVARGSKVERVTLGGGR